MDERIEMKLMEYKEGVKKILGVLEFLESVDIGFVEEIVLEKRFKRYEIFWMMFVLEKGLFRYKDGIIFLSY